MSFTTRGTTRTQLRAPGGVTSSTATVTIANLSQDITAALRFNSSAAPDFSSIDRIVAHVRATASDSSTHALAMSAWRTVRDYRYHWYPATPYDNLHSPVKLLGVYGCGLCDDSAAVLASLWRQLGLDVRMQAFAWHIVSEYGKNGKWHLLDADLGNYAPSPQTGEPLSLAAVLKNPDLLAPVPHPDTAEPRKRLQEIKSLYRQTSAPKTVALRDLPRHRIVYQLAPGEQVTRFALSDLGYASYKEDYPPPPVLSNAVFEWEPTTTSAYFRSLLHRPPAPPVAVRNALRQSAQRRGTARTTATAQPRPRPPFVMPTTLPFVLTGGRVVIDYREKTPGEEPLDVRFSGDGIQWAFGTERSFTRRDDGVCTLAVDVPESFNGIFRVFLGIGTPGQRSRRCRDTAGPPQLHHAVQPAHLSGAAARQPADHRDRGGRKAVSP